MVASWQLHFPLIVFLCLTHLETKALLHYQYLPWYKIAVAIKCSMFQIFYCRNNFATGKGVPNKQRGQIFREPTIFICQMHSIYCMCDWAWQNCRIHFYGYRIAPNFDGGNVDGYRLFKKYIYMYLMKNILTVGHYLSPYNCKHCIVFNKLMG